LPYDERLLVLQTVYPLKFLTAYVNPVDAKQKSFVAMS